MINPMDLTGKKILLSGATGGIGQVVAQRLADVGGQVVLLDGFWEKMEVLLDRLGGAPHSRYFVNLEDPETIEPVMKRIHEKEGTLDGFVHCAGIAPMRPPKMTKYETVLHTMNINYFSFMEIVRCLAMRNRFADGGSMVAMSSTGSFHGKPTKAAYSASKAAMDASIRCLICDLKERKIRINSVAPSWVNTEMLSDFLNNYPDSKDVQELREKQFMGITEPVEVANVIAFLLSDATKTITGSTIVMDGGISQG
jgi:NAD(P)-dependent dehydrogenase (short-subunit alcohol dehydrogenase family)